MKPTRNLFSAAMQFNVPASNSARRGFLTLAAGFALSLPANATVMYWDGNGTLSTNWTNIASLYALADGSNPTSSAGANDDVVFVYSGLDNTMYLTQNTGIINVRSLTFNNTGISQIRAANAARILNIGAGGITVNSGAGAVLLGRSNNSTGSVILNFKLAADQTWTNNDNDTLEFYNNGSGSAIDTNGKVLSLAGTGNFNLGAPISGAGSLTKGGAGTLTLNNAANSYTGDTTVNAGTLKLGASGTVASANLIVGVAGSSDTVLDVTAKSAFTIDGTQTLKGIGTVNIGAGKTVTIDGAHSVGNAGTDGGVGTQTVTGNLDYGGTSIFEWDINTGTATYDKVALSGSLTVASNAQFKVVSSTGFSDGFWSTTKSWSDIFGSNNLGFDASKFLYVANGSSVSAPSTYGSFSITNNTLTWTAVPEPSSALAGLLIAAGLLRRRRA